MLSCKYFLPALKRNFVQKLLVPETTPPHAEIPRKAETRRHPVFYNLAENKYGEALAGSGYFGSRARTYSPGLAKPWQSDCCSGGFGHYTKAGSGQVVGCCAEEDCCCSEGAMGKTKIAGQGEKKHRQSCFSSRGQEKWRIVGWPSCAKGLTMRDKQKPQPPAPKPSPPTPSPPPSPDREERGTWGGPLKGNS